jgi:hypothetical protein
MTMLNRRDIVKSCMALLAATLAPPSRAKSRTRSTASLKAYPGQDLASVPADFIGLSYESQELQNPAFFSPGNRELIARFRDLTAQGTLRLGGDTADYAFWSSHPGAVPPARPKRKFAAGDPRPNLTWRVTPAALRNLRGFLDATGWRCLYSLNFGTSLPDVAAAEARAVARVLDHRLIEFHIGNEPDRYGSTIRNLRTWDVDAYMQEWLPFARAVAQATPAARIGMPDISTRTEWFAGIRRILAMDPLRERLGCLAHHHYFGGPPSNPQVSTFNMLRPDPNVLLRAQAVSSAARWLGTEWRMTEGNSCFLGGKPGVSDVFAASLWIADYLLLIASMGYAGANIHGGSGNMVASSLGGLLPGERLLSDPDVPHNRPFYTPIAGGPTHFTAAPSYYGMQFAGAFAGLKMIRLEFDPGRVNATAYAARDRSGGVLIAIINRDESRTLHLGTTRLRMLSLLRAQSLSSQDVVLLTNGTGRELSAVPPACAVCARLA